MKRFICVMLFVVCLFTFSACTVVIEEAEVIAVLKSIGVVIGDIITGFYEIICRPVIEALGESLKNFFSGIFAK